jgi:hypothetical protein
MKARFGSLAKEGYYGHLIELSAAEEEKNDLNNLSM